jgi:polar amino acid transport system ATP-binding protein/sulfate transport system ATP-binding protein
MFSYQKTDIILKVENVSLMLDGNQILKDVNVEVKDIVRPEKTQGQVVGFLGPSGIGKTKFFEILAGILTPTSGQVLINHPLEPVQVGKVGVVQQNYPLFVHHTVYGNLELAAKRGNIPTAERKDRIYDVIDRFNLRNQAQHYPSQLSGGQKQRTAIAQQLLCSEHFLLLDEPFSGLDVLMIEKVSDMICEIACSHEKNTVIIVSHDIVSTAAISDTLWVMGRDRDGAGNVIPGAKIKHTYDLMERGLAWRKGIEGDPAFMQLVSEVKGLFHQL